MTFWDVVQILLRSLALVLGTALVLVYMAAQLFQRIPSAALALKPYDYVMYFMAALLFSLGTNSYWGFLAFAPMLLLRLGARKFLVKSRVSGSGRWMEIRWQKLSPKGFSNLPRDTWEQVSREMQRLPKDTHFMLPRFATLWAIRYFLKRAKNQKSANLPQLRGREAEMMGMLDDMAKSVIQLETAKTKSFTLPFGVLQISRL